MIKKKIREKAQSSEKKERKQRGNGRLKASYTVEAAILMSITFFVLAALLICTFYLHDRAVLQAVTCETASAGSNMATQREREEVTLRLKNALTAQRLMGSRNLSGRTEAGEKKVQADWSGEYPVPGMVMNYLTRNRLPVHVSWSAQRVQAADMIRKIRGIRKLTGGGDT